MIISVDGIILNTRSFSETSKILDIFTKEYGIIGVLSKGCKSLKSSLRSVSDKLVYANFTIFYKKDKLSILAEASIINNYSNIKKDITKISYASYLTDLTNQVYKQNNTIELYDLLISALNKIDENYSSIIITNIIELKYLNYLGVLPKLDGCAICGSKNILTVSSDMGGYICPKCYSNEYIVSEKTIKLLRMFLLVDISKISKLNINKKIVNEINNFIDDYYDRYTGLYLKSKSFLKKLENK